MSGTVTVKAGTGFDAPWIVAEAPADGSAASKVEAQRAYLLAAFGMSPDDPDIKDLSLAEVVAQAGYHFQGLWSKAAGRSANVGGRGRAAAKPPAKEEPAPEAPPTHDEAVATAAEGLGAEVVPDEPEVKAEPKAEHPHQGVLDEIAAASNKKELQAIFHGNKDAMQGDVLAALQARAKAL